jgi:hypothetical protein
MFKTVKVSGLSGATLDWAVAKCEGFLCEYEYSGALVLYSTDWSQGGPIIEREGMSLDQFADYPKWQAECNSNDYHNRQHGPTPLIAAMRCYVTSKLGDEVEIPEELI